MNNQRKSNQELVILAQTCIESFYQTKTTYLRYLGGGSYGRVFLFAIPMSPFRVVIKACLLDGMAEKEVQALHTLNQTTILPLVAVYHLFEKATSWPCSFILMQYIPGKNALFSLPLLLSSRKNRHRFAIKVIDNLAKYHETKNAKFGDINAPQYDRWVDYYYPFIDRILRQARQENARHHLEQRILVVLKEAYTYRNIIFEEPVLEASLIHGDYNVANIMVDAKGMPSAIIDPLHTMWADKEYDLFQLRNLTGDCFHLYATYKQRYPTSKRVDLKCAFYALFHELYVIFESGHRYDYILFPLVKRLRKELNSLKKELKLVKNDEIIA